MLGIDLVRWSDGRQCVRDGLIYFGYLHLGCVRLGVAGGADLEFGGVVFWKGLCLPQISCRVLI